MERLCLYLSSGCCHLILSITIHRSTLSITPDSIRSHPISSPPHLTPSHKQRLTSFFTAARGIRSSRRMPPPPPNSATKTTQRRTTTPTQPQLLASPPSSVVSPSLPPALLQKRAARLLFPEPRRSLLRLRLLLRLWLLRLLRLRLLLIPLRMLLRLLSLLQSRLRLAPRMTSMSTRLRKWILPKRLQSISHLCGKVSWYISLRGGDSAGHDISLTIEQVSSLTANSHYDYGAEMEQTWCFLFHTVCRHSGTCFGSVRFCYTSPFCLHSFEQYQTHSNLPLSLSL